MRLYRLGRISRLGNVEAGDDYGTFFEQTFSVSEQLKSFIEDDEYQRGLPQAVEKATALRQQIIEIYSRRKVVGDDDIEALHFSLLRFETSLNDELQRLHTYMVEPVAAYSFDRLIGAADTVFPKGLRTSFIPEQALTDFRSAGRCLAFDLPTACGFHVFRATDAMLRTYCDHFNTQPKGQGRDWGKYITALREALTNPTTTKNQTKERLNYWTISGR